MPDPNTLASQLIAVKRRAVLVVDNCPPDLHQRLTQACSRLESSVSLLTVEYDVRDDLPEETDVFRLEPASEEIIEMLMAIAAGLFSRIRQLFSQSFYFCSQLG